MILRLLCLSLCSLLCPAAKALQLGDLFTADNYEVYPNQIIPLPDTSVIMSAEGTSGIRRLGLNRSFTIPQGSDDRKVNIVLRVFRHPRSVSFGPVPSRASAASPASLSYLATRSPSPALHRFQRHSKLICSPYASTTWRTAPLRFCKADRLANANVKPLIVSAGWNTLLVPADAIAEENLSVGVFDISQRKFTHSVALTGGGSQHPGPFDAYGSANRETACFLTTKEKQDGNYDLFVHCFKLLRQAGRDRFLNRRTLLLDTIQPLRFRRSVEVEMSHKRDEVFVSYDRFDQVVVCRLNATTMETLPWFNRNFPEPRIVLVSRSPNSPNPIPRSISVRGHWVSAPRRRACRAALVPVQCDWSLHARGEWRDRSRGVGGSIHHPAGTNVDGVPREEGKARSWKPSQQEKTV